MQRPPTILPTDPLGLPSPVAAANLWLTRSFRTRYAARRFEAGLAIFLLSTCVLAVLGSLV